VVTVRALCRLALVWRTSRERVPDPDPLDHQHFVLDDDVAFRLARQAAISGFDPARLQRAPEGAGQSTSRRGDDVVERGCVIGVLTWRGPIVLPHLVVRAENHRVGLRRKVGLPDRSSLPDDADARNVFGRLVHSSTMDLASL
jgi:hypothetical protein